MSLSRVIIISFLSVVALMLLVIPQHVVLAHRTFRLVLAGQLHIGKAVHVAFEARNILLAVVGLVTHPNPLGGNQGA